MNDQAPVATHVFPPGQSPLERLPDEIKLRIGCCLKDSPPVQVDARDGNIWIAYNNNAVPQQSWTETDVMSEDLDHREDYDSILALASTSTRLCNVFFNEYSKKHGLQNTLCRSIDKGYINLVHRAVEEGADMNQMGTKLEYRRTPLRLAVEVAQLPVVLYLLRRGVDKADELVMGILRDPLYQRVADQISDQEVAVHIKNNCRCTFLPMLLAAALSGYTSKFTSRLPFETQKALTPTGRHLWFILRTCMKCQWECGCGANEDGECPMRLISLLQRYGAKWTPCEAVEFALPADDFCMVIGQQSPGSQSINIYRYSNGGMLQTGHDAYSDTPRRGAADFARFKPTPPRTKTGYSDPSLVKPSVAGAMDPSLLRNKAYQRDHCLPFITALLEHGVSTEEGDLAHAMNLASNPASAAMSIPVVRVLLKYGTKADEPGAMETAMRLACMETTKDAAMAFVSLLLEYGASPSARELQDEIQGAAEKWWIQAAWQSSGVFHQILRLLEEHGLDSHIAGGILAILGLYHSPLTEGDDAQDDM
ncbi:hypothetical protein J7T55_010661 [Diaporthe amygdali]|uniref:uncharacterized protein n=1 Tax=Phomopsis amygdali TaxID=1214568 RepID=UPI0022FEAD8C|nr:uncharacterized protein J7T55_010661 [Diaporthe amygdali]KAJ0114272.1 hypothetical protein J7T55_010661 [Diaporthe amygdali]